MNSQHDPLVVVKQNDLLIIVEKILYIYNRSIVCLSTGYTCNLNYVLKKHIHTINKKRLTQALKLADYKVSFT